MITFCAWWLFGAVVFNVTSQAVKVHQLLGSASRADSVTAFWELVFTPLFGAPAVYLAGATLGWWSP